MGLDMKAGVGPASKLELRTEWVGTKDMVCRRIGPKYIIQCMYLSTINKNYFSDNNQRRWAIAEAVPQPFSST